MLCVFEHRDDQMVCKVCGQSLKIRDPRHTDPTKARAQCRRTEPHKDTENMLLSIGITTEKYKQWKESLGLAPKCESDAAGELQSLLIALLNTRISRRL